MTSTKTAENIQDEFSKSIIRYKLIPEDLLGLISIKMQNQNRQPNRNTPQRAQPAAANRSQNMCQRINSEFSDMNINPTTNIPVRLQPNPSVQMASTPTYRRTPERQQRYSNSDVAINRSQNRIGRSPSQHSFNGWDGNDGQRVACSTFTEGAQQGLPVRRGFGPAPNISPIRSTPAGSNYNPRINLNDIYNNSKNDGYHNTRRCCTEYNKMYSPSGSAQPTNDGGRTASSSRQQQSERPCCSHEWNPVHPSHHTPHMRRPQLSVKESSAGRAFVSGDLSKGPGPSTSAGKSEKDGAKDKNEAAERKPFADLQPACGVVINITEQMRPKCKTGGAPCIRRWTKANLRGPDGKIVDSIEREERYNCSETEDAPQRPESTGAKPKQNPAGAECREGNAGNGPFPIYEDLCCPQNAQRCQLAQPIQQAQQCPGNPGNAPFPIYQDPSSPRNVQRYQAPQTPPQRNIVRCQALGIEAFNLPQGQGRFFTPTHVQQQAQLPWYDNNQQNRIAPAQNASGSRGGRNASGGFEPGNGSNSPRDQGQGQSPCDELAQQYRPPPRDSSRSQCDPAQRVEPVQAAQAAQSCLPCGLLVSPTREPIRPSHNIRTENGCPDPNESRDNTSYFGLPGAAAGPSPSVCIKNLQSQQFQCLVKDLCSPGVIQETLDGKRNFNVTAFALAFGNCQNAPCNKPLVEPISLLEAFFLRINWEREQVKCLMSQNKKEKDKAKKVDNKDLDKYFASKPDTELNGAISSFLKAELEAETEKKLEPIFNAEIFKKQSTLAGSEFNNFQTQTLLTYTAKTTPKEATA